MPSLEADLFARLSEWPHRGVGTEEEMEARESLMAALMDEPGLDITEEGFMAPASYLNMVWTIAGGLVLCLWVAPFAPFWVGLAALGLFVSHLLFFDWRRSPLAWIGSNRVTANLVASKGAGRRLLILMAHLDSAPASFAYRPDQVPHFKQSVWLGTAIIGVAALACFIGGGLPIWIKAGLTVALIATAVMTSIDFWRFGYVPGASDNLSGVVAVAAAARRLWRDMPPDTEVRLVVTSAEEAGMLGAQAYWQTHREALKARETYLINVDTVGVGDLAFVTETAGFTKQAYDNALTATAARLGAPIGVGPARHHVGDFDSVWFNRGGVASLTLAAYDEKGLMPRIHTPDDRPEHVSTEKIAKAAAFTEAIARDVLATTGETP